MTNKLIIRNQHWRLYQEPDGELLLVNEDTGRQISGIGQAEFVSLKAIIEQAEVYWREQDQEEIDEAA